MNARFRSSQWISIFVFSAVLRAEPLPPDSAPPGSAITAAVHPKSVRPGSVVEFSLTLTLPEGWIAYDVEQMPGAVLPTRITLKKSNQFTPLETFAAPVAIERVDPQFNDRLVRFFDQSPTFRRPILIAASAEIGRSVIEGTIDFQIGCIATGRCEVIHRHPFRAEFEVLEPSLPREPAPLAIAVRPANSVPAASPLPDEPTANDLRRLAQEKAVEKKEAVAALANSVSFFEWPKTFGVDYAPLPSGYSLEPAAIDHSFATIQDLAWHNDPRVRRPVMEVMIFVVAVTVLTLVFNAVASRLLV